MTKTDRNQLCPCGSGKKYKKCCLVKAEDVSSRRRDEQRAIVAALEWLWMRHGDAVQEVLREDFFGALSKEGIEAVYTLPGYLQDTLNINFGEWLITEAHLHVEGREKPVKEVLLGPGGPLLSSHGRLWLQEISSRSMGIFEVRGVTPGEGIEVADLLRPVDPPVSVREATASRSLVRWDTFGGRLARQGEEWILTGAVYPFSRDTAAALRDDIISAAGTIADESAFRRIASSLIPARWLLELIAERPVPRLVDASTGEPILLVTDHYRVENWQALEISLAAQPDVEGDRTEGWTRFIEAGEIRRSRAALNVKEPESLEVFCRTLKLADEARKWLEKIAEGAVRFRIREVVDPRSPKALEGADKDHLQPELPPEVRERLEHEYMSTYYGNWMDEPVPALGGRTPRRAAETAGGRAAVADLLKEYEQHEARKSQQDGTKPFDFGFLWERLGLERNDLVSTGAFPVNVADERGTRLLEAFERQEGRYKREEMEEALGLREELVPALIRILAELADDPEGWVIFGGDVHLYAAALLAHFREVAAHPMLIRAFMIPKDLLDEIWGEMTTETLPALLLNTAGGASKEIEALAANPEADIFVRWSALDALILGVGRGDFSRDDVIEFLRTLFESSTSEIDPLFPIALVGCACDIFPLELMEEIRHVFERGAIPAKDTTLEDVEYYLSAGKDEAFRRLRETLAQRVPEDIHGYLSWVHFENGINERCHDSSTNRGELKKKEKLRAKRKTAKKAKRKNRK